MPGVAPGAFIRGSPSCGPHARRADRPNPAERPSIGRGMTIRIQTFDSVGNARVSGKPRPPIGAPADFPLRFQPERPGAAASTFAAPWRIPRGRDRPPSRMTISFSAWSAGDFCVNTTTVDGSVRRPSTIRVDQFPGRATDSIKTDGAAQTGVQGTRTPVRRMMSASARAARFRLVSAESSASNTSAWASMTFV